VARLLHRLGMFSARRPLVMIGVWVLLGVVVFGAVAAFGSQTNNDLSLPGTDSQAAKDQAVALARGTEGVADVVDNITVAGGSAAMPGEHPAGEMGGGANPSANAAGTAPAPGGEHDAAVGGNAPNPEPDRPVGTVMDDAAITAAVKAKLLADSTVGGLKIDVDTRNGVVYLTGDHMKSQAEIDTAMKLAKETSGVKSVENKMVVGDKH